MHSIRNGFLPGLVSQSSITVITHVSFLQPGMKKSAEISIVLARGMSSQSFKNDSLFFADWITIIIDLFCFLFHFCTASVYLHELFCVSP